MNIKEFKEIWKSGVMKANIPNREQYNGENPTLSFSRGIKYKLNNKERVLTGDESIDDIAKITEEMMQ